MTATVRGISVGGRTGSINQDGEREYSVVYKVTTDDKRDGPSVVRTAFGIPNVGDTYQPGNDLDVAAVVVSKEATQGDSPWDWAVEVRYSTNPGERAPSAFENPLDQPPELTYSFQERRVLVPGTHNDPRAPASPGTWYNGVYAPNGELFQPQPEVDVSEPVLHVRRNVATIVPAVLMGLANCVNYDLWQGAEPRQLRLKPPTAVRKWHKNSGYYWEVDYAIEFRWETWDVTLRNDGTYYWVGGKPTSIWSTTTRPRVKMDLSGNPRVINLTTNGDVNTTALPTFTRIRYYREISFGSLGLL